VKIASRVFPRRARDEVPEAAADGPRRHRSLAIEQCHGSLPIGERKVEILDLGSASSETLAFYSGLRCKIHFADFYFDWRSGEARGGRLAEGSEAFPAACDRVLPFEASQRFDLVQAWDLFNYLGLDEIAALTAYLRRFSTDQAPLACLIWNQRRIPALPNHYAIIDLETVEYRPTTPSDRPGPCYKEPDLLRAMPGYRAARSFLLRHGVQEYIFSPEAAA
jgi:hypothetical protein